VVSSSRDGDETAKRCDSFHHPSARVAKCGAEFLCNAAPQEDLLVFARVILVSRAVLSPVITVSKSYQASIAFASDR